VSPRRDVQPSQPSFAGKRVGELRLENHRFVPPLPPSGHVHRRGDDGDYKQGEGGEDQHRTGSTLSGCRKWAARVWRTGALPPAARAQPDRKRDGRDHAETRPHSVLLPRHHDVSKAPPGQRGSTTRSDEDEKSSPRHARRLLSAVYLVAGLSKWHGKLV